MNSKRKAEINKVFEDCMKLDIHIPGDDNWSEHFNLYINTYINNYYKRDKLLFLPKWKLILISWYQLLVQHQAKNDKHGANVLFLKYYKPQHNCDVCKKIYFDAKDGKLDVTFDEFKYFHELYCKEWNKTKN